MADVTEDLRLPNLAQVKALIDLIDASDVGAMRMIATNNIGSYSTLLDVVNSLGHGGCFSIHNSSPVVTADDYPVKNKEMSFFVFGSKDNVRRIVIAFKYNDNGTNIYKRDLFNGKWKTAWNDMTSIFLQLDGSVPMSGDLNFNGGYGQIRAGSIFASFEATGTTDGNRDNRRYLQISHQNHGAYGALKNALQLREVNDGIEELPYNIFGEHNVKAKEVNVVLNELSWAQSAGGNGVYYATIYTPEETENIEILAVTNTNYWSQIRPTDIIFPYVKNGTIVGLCSSTTSFLHTNSTWGVRILYVEK